MSARTFFDTSILIYTVTLGDVRMAKAENLLAKGGVVNVQILNEFAAVARRKLKMSWAEIRDSLQFFRVLCGPAAALTVETHEAGLRIAERYGYNIYDALILAAALEAGCDALYSEDMQDSQRIDSLTIRNPFAARAQ